MKAATFSMQVANVTRLFMAAAMALILGLILVQGAETELRKPQSKRLSNLNQRDMCETVGDGTLQVTDSPFLGIKTSDRAALARENWTAPRVVTRPDTSHSPPCDRSAGADPQRARRQPGPTAPDEALEEPESGWQWAEQCGLLRVYHSGRVDVLVPDSPAQLSLPIFGGSSAPALHVSEKQCGIDARVGFPPTG